MAQGIATVGFDNRRTIRFGRVALTLVHADVFSVPTDNGPVSGGSEVGSVIEGEGKTIYCPDDTDVMADMEVVEAPHHPRICVLLASGRFTMDMKRAAWAAKRYSNPGIAVPCQLRIFPLLE